MTALGQNGAAETARQRYLADQVATATPAQRLLMLFEHADRLLAAAELAFDVGDLKAVNDSLVGAQQIVAALLDPLGTDSDLTRSLRSVYEFCLGQLVAANIGKDRALIEPCREMLGEIALANRRAAVGPTPQPAPLGAA